MKSPRTIHPLAFELMQYFYGTVHEPLIHAYLQYDGTIDEQTLIRAVTASIAYVPLLECVFSPAPLSPRWISRGFTGADLVRVESINPQELDVRTNAVLTRVLTVESEPPLQLTLLHAASGDRLCVVMSHLVCDGAGLKQYLYLLSQLYTSLLSGLALPPIRQTIRSAQRLFRHMRWPQRLSLWFAKYDSLQQSESLRVPYAGDPAHPLIRTRSLPSDSLATLKAFAHAHHATINDVLLAAYARALAKATGESRISLPCPVDLRKYLKVSDALSICNLTTNYVVAVDIANDTPFFDTLRVVSSQLAEQKTSNACLKSVLLVEFAFRWIPFCFMKRLFPQLFTIPVTSYTNLGLLDAECLRFGTASVTGGLLTGAVKYSPYFQISVSSFEQTLTLSCNLYGTASDCATADAMLESVISELTTLL
jgi:NRPS condensation-like uncharacterized protein